MRKYLLVLCLGLVSFGLGAPMVHAQSALLDLPRGSQHATLMQRVGLTNITVNYHRPLVNGRKIWGRPGALGSGLEGRRQREHHH